jgi:hypothetical protein
MIIKYWWYRWEGKEPPVARRIRISAGGKRIISDEMRENLLQDDAVNIRAWIQLLRSCWGALAAAVSPNSHRSLLAGAGLATLPDLDALLLLLTTEDPVLRMTMHQSFSHSLFVLPFLAALIWWLFLRLGRGRVCEAPTR